MKEEDIKQLESIMKVIVEYSDVIKEMTKFIPALTPILLDSAESVSELLGSLKKPIEDFEIWRVRQDIKHIKLYTSEGGISKQEAIQMILSKGGFVKALAASTKNVDVKKEK